MDTTAIPVGNRFLSGTSVPLNRYDVPEGRLYVWAKTLQVFRHKEWRWEKKISCDGWVGSHTHRRFFSRRAILWSILRVDLMLFAYG